MIVEDRHDAALLDAISDLASNAKLVTLKIGICDSEGVARWDQLCHATSTSLEELGLRYRPRDMMPTAQAGHFCEHHTERICIFAVSLSPAYSECIRLGAALEATTPHVDIVAQSRR